MGCCKTGMVSDQRTVWLIWDRLLYLSAVVSLDSAAARVSLVLRPSSSFSPTSSAEASARLLFDSTAAFASSSSVDRRCSRALSSLVFGVWGDEWKAVVRKPRNEGMS